MNHPNIDNNLRKIMKNVEGGQKQQQHRVPLSLQNLFVTSNQNELMNHDANWVTASCEHSNSMTGSGNSGTALYGIHAERILPKRSKSDCHTNYCDLPVVHDTTTNTSSSMKRVQSLATFSTNGLHEPTNLLAIQKSQQEQHVLSCLPLVGSQFEIFSLGGVNQTKLGRLAVPVVQVALSPQKYLDEIMTERGYCTKSYKTIETGYYSFPPSPYQIESYNFTFIKNVIKNNNVPAFQQLVSSGILSSNPCNKYGESVLHMVCRRGYIDLLRIMILELGTRIQISDDYGRTPLHDACWGCDPVKGEPNFHIITLLLDHDPTLLQMQDYRGALPLSYVTKEHYQNWFLYLDRVKDTYWPNRSLEMTNPIDHNTDSADIDGTTTRSCYIHQKPNSCPIQDPKNAVSLGLLKQVLDGSMLPQEALRLQNESRRLVFSNVQNTIATVKMDLNHLDASCKMNQMDEDVSFVEEDDTDCSSGCSSSSYDSDDTSSGGDDDDDFELLESEMYEMMNGFVQSSK